MSESNTPEVTPLTAKTPEPTPGVPVELTQEQIKAASHEMFVKHNHAIEMPDFDTPVPWYKRNWYHDVKFALKEWNNDHNPFTCYKYVTSADEYINLPWSKRSVWYFWYMDAIISDGRHILGRKSEREKIENFIKSNHRIQYWVRQTSWKISHKLGEFKDWCDYLIFPRNKWLTKKVPRSWADKTWLLPEVMFEFVVHFVEGEEALDVVNWENSSEQHSQFEKELKDCYDYIKVRRPALQKQHDNSYPDDETMTGDYWKDYGETNRLEVLIDQEDTKYLTWIVKNRDFLWT